MTDINIHETDRNTKTARASQNPCSEALAGRSRYSPNCSNRRGIAQFCRSLVGCLPKRRATSTEKQAASLKAMQIVPRATLKASKASLKRPKSKWLQNRLVDTAKDSAANKKAFWPILSPFRSLVCSLSYWLELSEARKKGQRTRRASNSRLAKEGLALYKKKPVESAEPSYWSMKAVLCLPRPFAAPGHQKARHLFNIVGPEEAAYRPFLLSASLRNAIDWACISLSRTTTSGWMILKNLFRCCWNIFPKVLSWFSTVRWFIAGQKEDCVKGFPGVLILNGSRLMPLNLIRSSRSGITVSTASLPTTFLMTYWHLKKPYVNLSTIFAHKNLCCVRFSKKPDLKYDSFH